MAIPGSGQHPPRRCALAGLLLLAAVAPSCASLSQPAIPLRTLELGRKTGGTCLAVLLPGRWDEPESFAKAGFAEAVARRHLSLDLMAVDAHLGYYRNRSVTERLQLDVLEPARAAGYRTIWIVGTSLGGLGGILSLRDHPQDLAGVLALAPFLGPPEVIREIRAAGGPARWMPPRILAADDVGRELWSFLAPWAAGPQERPLHLGWGTEDSLAEANEVLASMLPRERIYTAHGGHDWKTWASLWEQFLDRTTLCGPPRWGTPPRRAARQLSAGDRASRTRRRRTAGSGR